MQFLLNASDWVSFSFCGIDFSKRKINQIPRKNTLFQSEQCHRYVLQCVRNYKILPIRFRFRSETTVSKNGAIFVRFLAKKKGQFSIFSHKSETIILHAKQNYEEAKKMKKAREKIMSLICKKLQNSSETNLMLLCFASL